MARVNFKNFTPRPKPRKRPKPKKRPRVHKKSKNKDEKRMYKKYNRQGR